MVDASPRCVVTMWVFVFSNHAKVLGTVAYVSHPEDGLGRHWSTRSVGLPAVRGPGTQRHGAPAVPAQEVRASPVAPPGQFATTSPEATESTYTAPEMPRTRTRSVGFPSAVG